MGEFEIIKAIADFGFMVVASGVMIIIFLILWRRREKEYSKQEETINKILEKFTDKQPNILTPETDSLSELTTEKISNHLCDLVSNIGAIRAMTVMYHNGMRDITGNHFLNMSCRNEATSYGVQKFQLNFQNIPRSFLIYWCKEIRENKYCFVHNVDELKEQDYSMHDFLKKRGIEAAFGRALNDSQGNLIGFLVVEYVHDNYPEDEVLHKTLQQSATIISTLLSLSSSIPDKNEVRP